MSRWRLTSVVASLTWLAFAAGAAQAAPTLKLSVRTEDLHGYQGSGNIAGAGARLEIGLVIAGTEYNGSPPPLEHLDLTLPRGMRFSTAGFARYPLEAFTEAHPGGPGCTLDGGPPCQRGVVVGPETAAAATVAFGSQLVPETSSVQSFDDSAGGTSLSIFGHEPVLLEILAKSAPPTPAAGGGETLHWQTPEVETVPGAQLMSLTHLAFNLGSGLKRNHKSHYTVVMPTTCGRDGMRFRMQARFYSVAALPAQTAKATSRVRCPQRNGSH